MLEHGSSAHEVLEHSSCVSSRTQLAALEKPVPSWSLGLDIDSIAVEEVWFRHLPHSGSLVGQ
jgi:hypothetical protein